MEENKIIIVPAYNEARSLGDILKKIKLKFPHINILVIDDASEDNTYEIAQEKEVKIIKLPFNLGIGGAVQTGLKYAVEQDYDVAIRIDADGQHIPEEIRKLLSFLDHDKHVDIVIGSRYNKDYKYGGSKMRKFATGLLSTIVSIITDQKFTDVTSGFFALRKNAIKFLADNYPEDYPEVESIILLKKNNFNIVEIPVTMNVRIQGVSSITALKSVYYMVRVLLAILIFSLTKKTLKIGDRKWTKFRFYQ